MSIRQFGMAMALVMAACGREPLRARPVPTAAVVAERQAREAALRAENERAFRERLDTTPTWGPTRRGATMETLFSPQLRHELAERRSYAIQPVAPPVRDAVTPPSAAPERRRPLVPPAAPQPVPGEVG